MTDSVYLRLAGPLQSWAKPAISGNYVNTNEIPTLSALCGLVAGMLGYPRNQWPEWISDIDFTVRVDKQPQFANDFQTIGSREDEFAFRKRLAIMQGIPARSASSLAFKPGEGSTVIARRTYLSDAEFLVRMTLESYTEQLDQAASDPLFSTYLGRKAFPATFPFYLGVGNAELINQIPVVKPDQGSSKRTPVLQHVLGMGPDARPSQVSVPTASSRADWLRQVETLGLKRRSTI